MAGYVPWHGKKRATFLRREEELRRILWAGGTSDLLRGAIGELRDSRVRYLRSEYSRFDRGDGTSSARLAKLEAEILAWSSKDDATILREYQESPDRNEIDAPQ